MNSFQSPITYINKSKKIIENPISSMSLEDFRKYTEEMLKIRENEQKYDQNVILPEIDSNVEYLYKPSDKSTYNKMISNNLKACLAIRKKKK
jgi:hypothetical protein